MMRIFFVAENGYITKRISYNSSYTDQPVLDSASS